MCYICCVSFCFMFTLFDLFVPRVPFVLVVLCVLLVVLRLFVLVLQCVLGAIFLVVLCVLLVLFVLFVQRVPFNLFATLRWFVTLSRLFCLPTYSMASICPRCSICFISFVRQVVIFLFV